MCWLQSKILVKWRLHLLCAKTTKQLKLKVNNRLRNLTQNRNRLGADKLAKTLEMKSWELNRLTLKSWVRKKCGCKRWLCFVRLLIQTFRSCRHWRLSSLIRSLNSIALNSRWLSRALRTVLSFSLILMSSKPQNFWIYGNDSIKFYALW